MEAVTIYKQAQYCREQAGDRSADEEHNSPRGRCCQHGGPIVDRRAMECHPSRILAKRSLRRYSLPRRRPCPPPFFPLSPSTALPSVAPNGSRQRGPLPCEDDGLVGATRRSATSIGALTAPPQERVELARPIPIPGRRCSCSSTGLYRLPLSRLPRFGPKKVPQPFRTDIRITTQVRLPSTIPPHGSADPDSIRDVRGHPSAACGSTPLALLFWPLATTSFPSSILRTTPRPPSSALLLLPSAPPRPSLLRPPPPPLLPPPTRVPRPPLDRMKTTTDPLLSDDGYGNDAAVEASWAAEAVAFAERHLLLLASMPSPADVKLTPYVAALGLLSSS